MTDALTVDNIHKVFQQLRSRHDEPNMLFMPREQAQELNIRVRVNELFHDANLFGAFCAGYMARRPSTKIAKVNARAVKSYHQFCIKLAREEQSEAQDG